MRLGANKLLRKRNQNTVEATKGYIERPFLGFFRPREESFNENLEPAIIVSDKKEITNIISTALAGDKNKFYIVR